MASWRLATEVNAPRRMRLRVMTEKKFSTALIQEAEVGVEVEAQHEVMGQPVDDFGMFVGGVVVGDGVDDLACRNGALDGVEKLDEFLMSVPGHAAPNDGAVEDVEGGEQGGSAVADVIVCHGAATAALQRQTGLGPIERLDLALLVD